jgi:hypothetical protein
MKKKGNILSTTLFLLSVIVIFVLRHMWGIRNSWGMNALLAFLIFVFLIVVLFFIDHKGLINVDSWWSVEKMFFYLAITLIILTAAVYFLDLIF